MMKAGTYYVGDLCYVLHDVWNEVCDIIFASNDMCEGEHTLKDGRKFVIFSTRWGDGTYRDDYQNLYDVDAGIIGCILLSDIRQISEDWWTNDPNNGNIIEFNTDFHASSDGSVLTFGHIMIDTDPNYVDDEDICESQEWESYDPHC